MNFSNEGDIWYFLKELFFDFVVLCGNVNPKWTTCDNLILTTLSDV